MTGGLKNKSSGEKSVAFSAAAKQRGGESHLHLLTFTHPTSAAKVADDASVAGEPSDVCETADASFKPDVWEHFCFLVSRNERKGDGKQYADTAKLKLIHTRGTFLHIL